METGRHLDELGESLSWRDLHLIFKFTPPSSPLFHAVHGHDWDEDRIILKLIHDQLSAANTQRGGKKGAKPTFYPLPSVLQKNTEPERLGTPEDADKITAWLEARNGTHRN